MADERARAGGGMKFRYHRGGLIEAMATCVEIEGRDALVRELDRHFSEVGRPVRDEDVEVEPYGLDERTGWDTHLVLVRGLGPVGFTDAPVEARERRPKVRLADSPRGTAA